MKRYRVFVAVLLIGVAIFLVLFYNETKKGSTSRREVPEESELQKLLDKNLDTNYPETPKEVVKLYSRFVMQFYKEKMTVEQIATLAKKAQMLMDDELIERNPYDKYLANLKDDIEKYQQDKKTISSYVVANSYDVEYRKFQGKQYAELDCMYYSKSKAGTERTIQTYTLRKDENGHWKILFWNLATKNQDE